LLDVVGQRDEMILTYNFSWVLVRKN